MDNADQSKTILQKYGSLYDRDKFLSLNEEMSFSKYLNEVLKRPRLARNAFQYIYDMIISKEVSTFERYRKTYTRYHFFNDKEIPIFGLEETLQDLVDFIHGAAGNYGTERRILLLHGPVGSAKSTICRLLKRGLERYSITNEGAWYTYKWTNLPFEGSEGIYIEDECPAALNDSPLRLMPQQMREEFLKDVNKTFFKNLSEDERDGMYRLSCEGDPNPRCKLFLNELLRRYDGDWAKVMEEHIVVVRKSHSETDRVGIGTFQPKDEKNQDSTELTGDMNFSKIGHFGSDSDPRAFNYDGEFQVSNRGMCEFIEMLKLANEFLYDLLGVAQEHQIKPKKFSQIVVDELIIAHSVKANEPIPYRQNGIVRWTTMERLHENYADDPSKVEVLAYDFENSESKWVKVTEITRHRWDGRLVETRQKWGNVTTTPNHAIYDREGEIFMPEDGREVMALRSLPDRELFETVNLLDLMPKGFLVDCIGSQALGHTKLPEKGFVRSIRQRASTVLKQELTGDDLSAFVKFLVWYGTEGHVTDDQVVISQKDRTSLESLQKDISKFCSAKGHISKCEQDQCYRLIYGCYALRDVAEAMCGRLSENKRLPDFVFSLSNDVLKNVVDELRITDGCENKVEDASEDYKLQSFRYKTVSRTLAAQVGFILSALNRDYSVYDSETKSGKTAYEVRYAGDRRQNRYSDRSRILDCDGEWVYDVGCEGIHNFACGVGLVVAHNTNNPEYERLKSNQFMEALRDRTIKVDVPYLLRHSDELKVYEHDYGPNKVRQHIMPHTLEIVAFFAILTRMAEDPESKLDLRDRVKLYDGKSLPGWTEDSVKELRDKFPEEGMKGGVSARFCQDKISNCLARRKHYVNVFHVLSEIREGLGSSSLITEAEAKARYEYCVELAIKELEDILKNEVQKALVADEGTIERLCNKYIDNVLAYVNDEKMVNPITNELMDPDERLMRSIEEKNDVPEQGSDDFRRTIATFIGTLVHRGASFKWDSNPQLKRALERKVFEDVKDTIKLSSLTREAAELDPDLQEKVDAIKTRLIKQYGYNQQSATDVLDFVSSIFARGDIVED